MEPVVVGPFLVVLVVASSCWDGSVVLVIVVNGQLCW